MVGWALKLRWALMSAAVAAGPTFIAWHLHNIVQHRNMVTLVRRRYAVEILSRQLVIQNLRNLAPILCEESQAARSARQKGAGQGGKCSVQ
jgi:hypothetical protein